MKIFQTIKTSTPGTALETIPGLEVPALPEKIAKIDQAGSNDFQAKLGESFMKFREALILALRDPTSLGLGGDTKAAAGLPSLIPISLIQESSTLKVMTSSERNKLAGIETGAQVNTVTSVQGRIGSVVVNASDVGLGDVDNTSDMNKPVSTAQATAINARLPKLTYVGVSMNGASLTAETGKMYGVYATGVAITLPSAATVEDGEVIGFMVGVNADRTLQINTTAGQNLVTPEGVKTTGYAVTGFARAIYAVCYFHTWMLSGLEDSAIDAAVSDMMTQSTNQYVTGVKTFKVPFITSPDGTANYSVFSFGSNPGGLVWNLQYKPTAKEANWFTTKDGLSPIVMKMVYNPNPRVEFPISPSVPTPTAGDSSALAANTEFVQTSVATKLDKTSLIDGGSSTLTALLNKTYTFSGAGTLNLPAADSSVPDGSYVEVYCQTATHTITVASTSIIISRMGTSSTNFPLSGFGRSVRFVKMLSYWFALSDSMANNIPRWSYNYTRLPNVDAVPWRLQGFGASSTMTIPLASSVEEGTQVGALIVTGGGTVTLQRSGSDQFVTPTGLASSYTLQGDGNSIVLVRVLPTAWACLSSPDAAIGVAMVGVKQSVPTTNVLTVTADNTVFLETEALNFSVFNKPVEVSFGCRCVGSVNLDLTVELYNPITSTSITLYAEASVPTNPLSIKSTIVKSGGRFNTLTTRLNNGASAVVLPSYPAVSSASYKIRCICSVGSGGGTVALFAPEVIITR